MKIKTNRLILNSTPSDEQINAISKLLLIPTIQKRTGIILPSENKKQAIHQLIAHSHSLVISNRSEPENGIGLIMLNQWIGEEGMLINRHYEIGYFISPQKRNYGLMTEAIKGMLNKLPAGIVLHAETQEDNLQSQRVLEKCGFRKLDNQTWILENLHLNLSNV